MTITRKQFIELGLGAAAGALLVACGDDETGGGQTTGAGNASAGGTGNAGGAGNSGGTGNSSQGGSGNASTGGNGTGGTGGGTGGGSSSVCTSGSMLVAAISANHGHTLEVPYDDVMAGVEMTYDASGDAGHCHEVTITAADFAVLAGGGTVVLHSCNGTDHEFVLSCEANPPAPGTPDCGATSSLGACD